MFKQEILVKDMGFLNNPIRKCFIDKTGTLTEKLKIKDFVIYDKSIENIYSKIFSIERNTNQPKK